MLAILVVSIATMAIVIFWQCCKIGDLESLNIMQRRLIEDYRIAYDELLKKYASK